MDAGVVVALAGCLGVPICGTTVCGGVVGVAIESVGALYAGAGEATGAVVAIGRMPVAPLSIDGRRFADGSFGLVQVAVGRSKRGVRDGTGIAVGVLVGEAECASAFSSGGAEPA